VAGIGVYASMAFATSRRTREIAVRIALGATPRLLTRQFLGSAGAVIAAGLIAGLAGALLLSRVARSLTSEFPLGFASLSAAAAILVAVALVASWIPLRRAMRLDPSAALQSE
jgi:putative ABC transport system permease protein